MNYQGMMEKRSCHCSGSEKCVTKDDDWLLALGSMRARGHAGTCYESVLEAQTKRLNAHTNPCKDGASTMIAIRGGVLLPEKKKVQ